MQNKQQKVEIMEQSDERGNRAQHQWQPCDASLNNDFHLQMILPW